MKILQKFQAGYLPLNLINILVQPRRTFEEIKELADNIAENGILNPPAVLILNKKEGLEYLETINSVWKTNYSLNDLKKTQYKKRVSYFILIAGERRFRAYKILFEEGCSSCKTEGNSSVYGKCYKKHFHRTNVEVRLCYGIKPMDALYLQLAENTHFRVPPQEEAHAFEIVFSAEKRENPKFSLARFARRVGRSPETIRKSLRYCELPEFIQKEVKAGNIKYGFALELGRLQDAKLDDKDLKFWLLRAMLDRNDLKHFKKVVDSYLDEKTSGQMEFSFNLENAYTTENLKKRIVAPDMIKAKWSDVAYLERVFRLFDEGKLGKKDSLFSEISPGKLFSRILELSVELTPYFKGTLSKTKYKELEKNIKSLSRA